MLSRSPAIALLAVTLAAAVLGQGELPGAIAPNRWQPPEDLLVFARRLGDPEDLAAALVDLQEMAPARRIDALRAGLRLPDGPAAVACASRLGYAEIDAWETRRFVSLLLPRVFRPGTVADYGANVRYAIGCDDLPALIAAMLAREGQPWDDDTGLSKIHVYVRGEHLPSICRMMRSSDLRIRGGALECLDAALSYTDRHRDSVVSLLWDMAGTPKQDPLPGPGLPLDLRRALQVTFLNSTPEIEGIAPADWVLRWLSQCQTLGAVDEALLLAIDRAARSWDSPPPRHLIIRAIGMVQAPFAAVPWSTLDDESDPTQRLFVTAAKARRGDPNARFELLAHPRESVLGLALLLDTFPEEARLHVSQRIQNGEIGALLAMVEDRLPWIRMEYALEWDREILAPLTPQVATCGAGIRHLSEAFLYLPGLRNRSLAETLLAKCEVEEPPPGLSVWPDSDFRAVASYLEVLFPERLLGVLRRWAGSKSEDTRNVACQLLLDLGDPQSDQTLIDWIGRSAREDRSYLRARLAHRTKTATIERHLREAGDDHALAVLIGIPHALAYPLDGEPEEDDATTRTLRAAIRRGDRALAIAALIDSCPPDEVLHDIGQVPEPAVTRYLRKLQARRDLHRYWWATGQLAIQGAPDAREEIWDVVHAGRYMTIENLDEAVLTLGRDPAALAYWLEELDSNCCRIATYGGNVVEELLGAGGIYRSQGFVTPFARIHRHWNPDRDSLRWSHLLNHFVIVPGP